MSIEEIKRIRGGNDDGRGFVEDFALEGLKRDISQHTQKMGKSQQYTSKKNSKL